MIKLKNQNDLKSPFDLVQFPSMGLFYKDKRAGLLVKYLTAIEENILTSPNASALGLTFNMALESVIMEEDVNINELLVGDRNAIILYLRATGYGDAYPVIITCPKCSQTGKTEFSVYDMQPKDVLQMPNENGCFTFTMPTFKLNKQPVVIEFAPLTVLQETLIFQEIAYNKANPKSLPIEVTLKYKYQIKSINGNSDNNYIQKISSRFPIKDSGKLREFIDKVEPGINNSVRLTCDKCSHSFYESYPINIDFLGLTPEYKNVIWEETFLLGHYSQGSISRDEAMSMATAERHWRIKRIGEEIDKKNSAEKKAAESSSRKT